MMVIKTAKELENLGRKFPLVYFFGVSFGMVIGFLSAKLEPVFAPIIISIVGILFCSYGIYEYFTQAKFAKVMAGGEA